jgi:hypothetical protein
MFPPQAFLTPPETIRNWLNVGHPDAGNKTLRDLLDQLVRSPFYHSSTQTNLYLIGKFFGFEDAWWIKKNIPIRLLKPVAAILADAWIYRKWLEERDQQLAEGFSTYFAKTVDHPEWIQAVTAIADIHYPINTPNSFTDLVWNGNLIDPECLKGSDWKSNKTKLGSAMSIQRLNGLEWLREIFETPLLRKGALLEDGLKFMSLAAISGDTDFFQALGNALKHTFKEEKQTSLEEIQTQPFRGQKNQTKARPWCRRLWVSRGLWVMPPHILEFAPFDLAKSTISELTTGAYSRDGKRTTNDELFSSIELWGNEFQSSTNSISLTLEGKKVLPALAPKGLPMEFVSFDLEDTN